MAENPTSSSTMYTTLGAPSGALGGSNGAQSGTESLMSTLMVPRNGLPIALFPRSANFCGTSARTGRPGLPGHPGSAAEQFGLGGRELRVAQCALLVQFGELVELVEHGRPRRSRWRGLLVLLRRRLLVLLLLVLRGLLVLLLLVLLLFEVRDALVLIGHGLRRLFPPAARASADRVRGSADRGRAQQRTSSPYHDLPPS